MRTFLLILAILLLLTALTLVPARLRPPQPAAQPVVTALPPSVAREVPLVSVPATPPPTATREQGNRPQQPDLIAVGGTTLSVQPGRERCFGYPSDENGSYPFNGRSSPCQRSAVEGARPRSGAETAGPVALTRIAEPIIGGRATWYPASGMIAAAGPALRGYLGKHWRGTLVSVCHGRCLVVRLSDWCLCTGNGGRLIDLSDDAFAQLAPLSRGVIAVSITRAVRVPRPPATDTAP